jgi:very-short-patch-repair endonuclease
MRANGFTREPTPQWEPTPGDRGTHVKSQIQGTTPQPYPQSYPQPLRKRVTRVYRTGAKPEKVVWARRMRKNPTTSEARLWKALRGKRLGGLGFRRQHIILGWIVDFYCPAVGLAVEVDGSSHEGRSDEDKHRDKAMRSLGIRVLRIPAGLVIWDLRSALLLIGAAAHAP